MSTSRTDTSSSISGSHLKRLTGSKKFKTGIVALGVLTLSGVATSALWADTAATSTVISTGTVDIKLDASDGKPTPSTQLAFENIQPNSTTTRVINLQNTGSLPVSVKMVTTSTADTSGLVAALTGEVTVGTGSAGVVLPTTPGYPSATLLGAKADVTTIPAGGSVPVTVKITVPTNLADTFQGKTGTAVFTFTATQK